MPDLKTQIAEYHLEPPLAEVVIDLQIRFTRIAGSAVQYFPALLEAVRGDQKEEAGIEVINAFATVFRSNDPREIRSFIGDVISLVEIKRPAGFSRCNLNGDFTGRIGELYKVLFWATGEILGDFFTELLGPTPPRPPAAL